MAHLSCNLGAVIGLHCNTVAALRNPTGGILLYSSLRNSGRHEATTKVIVGRTRFIKKKGSGSQLMDIRLNRILGLIFIGLGLV